MVNVMLTIVAQNQIFYSHTTVLLFVLLFLKIALCEMLF